MKMLRLVIVSIAVTLLALPFTSGVASAQIPSAPTITRQPTSTETGYYGPDRAGSGTFRSTATADGPLTGQWQVSTDGGDTWSDLLGETAAGSDEVDAEYGTPVTPENDQYFYRIQWTNAGGTTTSNEVYAFLHYAIVTTDPEDTTVTAGDSAQFSVTADSGGGYWTRWQVSTDDGQTFTNLGDFGENILVIAEATLSQDGNLYRAVVDDGGMQDTSEAALLTVEAVPPRRPSAPTNVAATQTEPGQVTVTWEPPADTGTEPVEGYTVTFDGETTTYPADAREAVFDLVLPGTYEATVLAASAAGDSPPAAASVTVTLAPTDTTDDVDEDDGSGDGDEGSDGGEGGADDEVKGDNDGRNRGDDDAAVDNSAGNRSADELPSELPATGGGAELLVAGVSLIAAGMRLGRRSR